VLSAIAFKVQRCAATVIDHPAMIVSQDAYLNFSLSTLLVIKKEVACLMQARFAANLSAATLSLHTGSARSSR
jgi:hypothetical protein